MANYQPVSLESFSTFNEGTLIVPIGKAPVILPSLAPKPTFCDDNTAKSQMEVLLMSNLISGPWDYDRCSSIMYVAGGAVARCFRNEFTVDNFDIDLYFVSDEISIAKKHAMVFMENIFNKIKVLHRAAGSPAEHSVLGYTVFYGKSALCEIHSPYLRNVLQIIVVNGNRSKYGDFPFFLQTFDFSHLQLCYTEQTRLLRPPTTTFKSFIFTSACQEAYRTGITVSNPLAVRIHAYRFVKAALQGWSICHIGDSFISNYNTCDYAVTRTSDDVCRTHWDANCKVWLPSNFNIVEMSMDPTIIANLNRKKFKVNPEYYRTPSTHELTQDYHVVFDDVVVFTLEHAVSHDNIMSHRHPLTSNSVVS